MTLWPWALELSPLDLQSWQLIIKIQWRFVTIETESKDENRAIKVQNFRFKDGTCSVHTPIFPGKKPWFPVRIFPTKPSQLNTLVANTLGFLTTFLASHVCPNTTSLGISRVN
jgi:hypothetical protein